MKAHHLHFWDSEGLAWKEASAGPGCEKSSWLGLGKRGQARLHSAATTTLP